MTDQGAVSDTSAQSGASPELQTFPPSVSSWGPGPLRRRHSLTRQGLAGPGGGGLALILLLAGCGGDGGSPAAPPPPSTPAPAPTPEPPPPPEPPAAPTALRVSAFGADFIEWTWNAVMEAEGYQVQFSTSRTFTDADEVIERAAEQTSYRKESLPPGTNGYLRVRSFVGSDPARVQGEWSETSNGTTDPLLREYGQGISTTSDGRILLELGPDDLTPGNRFDLQGRTVIFTPDGADGYRRQVEALEYEETVGTEAGHGDRVSFEGFSFAFGGETWDSFLVSQHGILVFGQSGALPRPERGATTADLAQVFESPTISPLYKPLQYGEIRVARQPDRVVVTWSTSEAEFYGAPGVPQARTGFQAVLRSDGSIRFSYLDVQFEDGVVGLFPYESGRKAGVLAELPSSRSSALPGYLDLLETTVHATHSDAVVVEFETRGPLPAPDPKRTVSYRLWFDFDRPFWSGDDADLIWFFDLRPNGDVSFSHGRVLSAGGEDNTVAVLALIAEWAGTTASIRAEAVEFYDGSWAGAEFSDPVTMEFPEVVPGNLSQAGIGSVHSHQETFSYTAVPDTRAFTCRIIEELGDRFDVVVFNSEFRVDHQESRTPFNPVYQEVEGIGLRPAAPPCGEGRLKGHWVFPVRAAQLNEAQGFSTNLTLFAHEFIHTWTAHASFVGRNGEREPLFGDGCNCHWRDDLHIPAAFPRIGSEQSSIMGGRFWRENSDGTFTSVSSYEHGGPAWLDLYLMGLAEATEVPDMFILRDRQPVVPGDRHGPHRGEKETVSIRQLTAAEGVRKPTAAESQQDFNAAFVYLLEPNRQPTRTLFSTHGRWREKTVEYWSHITGGRSVLTTTVDPVSAGSRR